MADHAEEPETTEPEKGHAGTGGERASSRAGGTADTDESVDSDHSVDASLEELLNRKERRGKLAEEADEDALLEAMEDRDTRASESLTVKVVPPRSTEFTCRGCFLLKHRSQLKDAKGMLCNDCA